MTDNSDFTGTLIVDCLNLCFRWKHTNNYKDFKEEFIRTVQSLAKSYKCKHIVIAADWGSSSYRKEIYPEYKADRKDKYKDQSEEDLQKFMDFFEEYERTIFACKEHFTVLRFKNVEADDIAAHLVKYKVKYGLKDIWLISSDGDWDLLINQDVSRFNWRSRKEVMLSNWNEHYTIPIEQFLSYKCLLGDKSDNIAGIAGIGPVRATSMLESFDSAFDIYDSIPLPGTAQYINNLNDSGTQILTNYELMDLISHCDQAIGEENIKEICLAMGEIPW